MAWDRGEGRGKTEFDHEQTINLTSFGQNETIQNETGKMIRMKLN